MTVLRLTNQPNQPEKVEGEGEGREKTWRTCSFPFVFSLTTPRVLSGEEGRGNDNVDRAGTGPEAHGRSSRRNSKRLRASAQDHRPGSSRGWEALQKPPTLDSTSSVRPHPRRSSALCSLAPSLSLSSPSSLLARKSRKPLRKSAGSSTAEAPGSSSPPLRSRSACRRRCSSKIGDVECSSEPQWFRSTAQDVEMFTMLLAVFADK